MEMIASADEPEEAGGDGEKGFEYQRESQGQRDSNPHERFWRALGEVVRR
jgi:hypothetical protein